MENGPGSGMEIRRRTGTPLRRLGVESLRGIFHSLGGAAKRAGLSSRSVDAATDRADAVAVEHHSYSRGLPCRRGSSETVCSSVTWARAVVTGARNQEASR